MGQISDEALKAAATTIAAGQDSGDDKLLYCNFFVAQNTNKPTLTELNGKLTTD